MSCLPLRIEWILEACCKCRWNPGGPQPNNKLKSNPPPCCGHQARRSKYLKLIAIKHPQRSKHVKHPLASATASATHPVQPTNHAARRHASSTYRSSNPACARRAAPPRDIWLHSVRRQLRWRQVRQLARASRQVRSGWSRGTAARRPDYDLLV